MAFQFPDPQTTPEFTADNGITYAWDVDDSKWQVKTTAALDDIRQDIIELEEEIDAIAPSVERGSWTFNGFGVITGAGIFTAYDKPIAQAGNPTGVVQSIQSVWIHSIDSAGKRHGFSDVEPKQFLEIFVEDRPDYGLFQVVEVHDYTDGAGDYWIVDVSFVQSLENTTRLNDDDLCRLKIFEAPSGGDAGGFVKKTGDTMSGNLIIDKSTESTDAEAGLALTGSRSSTTNSAATISFENDQSSTPGYLTYRSYATSHYFKFNQDVDLNNNGLHSVAQIRMQNDGYIGSGANQRIKIRTGGSSVNQAGTEIQRVGDDKRAFAIRGKAAGSSSITDFFWAYGNGGTGGDAINYTGKMTSNDNIVNKGYVDSKMPTYKITKSNGNYYVQ